MDKLPEDVQDMIYSYKYELEDLDDKKLILKSISNDIKYNYYYNKINNFVNKSYLGFFCKLLLIIGYFNLVNNMEKTK